MKRPRRTLSPETLKLDVTEVRDSILRHQTKQAALVVLQGSESDIGTHVILDRPVTIGRDPTVELTLQDDGISRQHCRIVFDGVSFVLEDLKSTNGTIVNGEHVKGELRLHPGDRIFVGGVVLKFTFADAVEVSYHAQMDTLVGTDDLTGLIAKRRFDGAYERALESARTRRTPLAVMMLDLDGLKLINDTHGHAIGAFTISEVGRLIGDLVRDRGAATRFGGDEFAAFFPGSSKEEARGIGESIREAMAKHPFEKDGIVLSPTISIGISAYPTDGKAVDVLLRKADEALYRAKHAGRDRVLF